jgi:hypothetical protein
MQHIGKHDSKTLLSVTRQRSKINRIGGCGLDSFGIGDRQMAGSHTKVLNIRLHKMHEISSLTK